MPSDSSQLQFDDRGAQTLAWFNRIVITAYGVVALTFMMTMYAFEHRGSRYILGFSLGCALSSAYGFVSGAWPFGIVEAIWTIIALRRYIVATRVDDE